MIAGHFGFAAIVKSRQPRVPLWSLMLATAWLDIVFIPMFVMKIETFEPVPGLHGGYGENIIHADYTHSLVGALVLSLVFGLIFGVRWGKRCSIVLALVSFSHWLLDLVVHRHDMPILPGDLGNLPRLGFGLWQFRRGSILAELLLVLVGAWCYWQAASAVTAAAQRGRARAMITAVLIFLCGVAVLALKTLPEYWDDIESVEKGSDFALRTRMNGGPCRSILISAQRMQNIRAKKQASRLTGDQGCPGVIGQAYKRNGDKEIRPQPSDPLHDEHVESSKADYQRNTVRGDSNQYCKSCTVKRSWL